MLTPPDLAPEAIAAHLGESYGLRVSQTAFLPLGMDVNAAVFRIETEDGGAYFLKLMRGAFNDLAVALPAWLHARGATAVMAPLPTAEGALWATGHDFAWILYPFFEGENAYHAALSDAQWVTLGATLRAIHDATPPPDLLRRLPREDYTPRNRDAMRALDQRFAAGVSCADPLSARLAAFWMERRADLLLLVERSEELAQAVQRRALPTALCHGDFHAGNILLGANNTLTLVDWDAAVLAPRERDLMFAGAHISGDWDDASDEALFYQGYGAPAPDPTAIAYYRYERIVTDIAEFSRHILDASGGGEDRAESLRLTIAQFAPQQDVALAQRAYHRAQNEKPPLDPGG